MNLSAAEKEAVRDYCLNHPLSRPYVNWLRALFILIATEVLLVFVLLSLRLPASSFFLCFETSNLILCLSFGKPILRLLVQLYQRYASESTRRQCACRPSCSEYALLALDKYWLGKAVWLIVRRVCHTCQLPGYKLDYP